MWGLMVYVSVFSLFNFLYSSYVHLRTFKIKIEMHFNLKCKH